MKCKCQCTCGATDTPNYTKTKTLMTGMVNSTDPDTVALYKQLRDTTQTFVLPWFIWDETRNEYRRMHFDYNTLLMTGR